MENHPVTIALALVSMIVWALGNRNGSKKMVYVGIGLSVIATGTFFLGY